MISFLQSCQQQTVKAKLLAAQLKRSGLSSELPVVLTKQTNRFRSLFWFDCELLVRIIYRYVSYRAGQGISGIEHRTSWKKAALKAMRCRQKPCLGWFRPLRWHARPLHTKASWDRPATNYHNCGTSGVQIR